MTAVTYEDFPPGAPRFMRKSRPNMTISFPQTMGA
jgi:hypothetical protein